MLVVYYYVLTADITATLVVFTLSVTAITATLVVCSCDSYVCPVVLANRYHSHAGSLFRVLTAITDVLVVFSV